MKSRKHIRLLTLVMAFLVFMTMTPVKVEARGAHLNKTKITITVGDSAKLKVKGASGKVKWSSSKKSVATVSKKGVVKAKKAGKTVVKAKIGKKTLKCKVIVEEDDWDDEDDDSSDTTTVTALSPVEDVKRIIVSKGYKNLNGDPILSMEKGDSTYTIIYDTDADRLEFMCFMMGEVSGTATIDAVHIEGTKDMTGTARLEEMLTSEYGIVRTSGTLNIATYSGGTSARVVVDDKTDSMSTVDDSKLVELTQQRVELTLAACRLLLYQQTGYSLADIGFTNYD